MAQFITINKDMLLKKSIIKKINKYNCSYYMIILNPLNLNNYNMKYIFFNNKTLFINENYNLFDIKNKKYKNYNLIKNNKKINLKINIILNKIKQLLLIKKNAIKS